MGDPVIVDAARTPFGERDGGLAAVHAAILLSYAQQGVLDRIGLDSNEVDQIIGGCVTQVGEQSASIARTAWLQAGLSERTGATTIDSQCGSAQQSLHLVAALIASDVIEVGVACGVESMSRLPLFAGISEETGQPRPDYLSFAVPDQFLAADRIAGLRGFTREDIDAFGLESQRRAAVAWAEGRLDPQIIPVEFPDAGGAGIARSRALGLRPRARIVSQCLIGGDPYYLLDGPVQAAEHLLRRTGMSIADIDVFEVNEAFASVPMSFRRVHDVDPGRLNINGGAIAIGHPVGASGIRLIATALDELERADGQLAMISVCAGGALASGAIIERL